MLSGDGAAEFHGLGEDLLHCHLHTVHLLFILFVGEEGGVQVAVTHVAEGADPELVTLRYILDVPDHLGKAVARDSGILEDGRRSHAGERRERGPACGGKSGRLFRRGGGLHRGGPVSESDLLHGGSLLLDGGGVSVALDEQKRLRIPRKPDGGVILDAIDGDTIEELQGAWNDLGGNDRRDGARGVLHVVIDGEHRFPSGRRWYQLQQHLGDDSKSSLRAYKKVAQTVASHIFHAFVARPDHLAIRKNHFKTHHVVACHPIFEAAESAGIFRHIATDGGNLHRSGVGRIEESGIVGCFCDLGGNGTRLGKQSQVSRVEFENPVHLRETQENASWGRKASTAQASTRSPRDDRDPAIRCKKEHFGDLLGRLSKDQYARNLLERGRTIVRIGKQFLDFRSDIQSRVGP